MLIIFLCAYWPSEYLLWRNVYASLLPIFILSSVFFWLLKCRSSLYILDTNSLSDIWSANIFPHSIGCLFTLLVVFLDAQMFWILIKSNLFTFSFLACTFVVRCQIIAESNVMKIFPMFSSKSIIVSILMFRSFIHFKLVFVYGVK